MRLKMFVFLIGGFLYAQFQEFSLTASYHLFPSFSAPSPNDTMFINIDLIPDTLRDTLGNIIGYDTVATAYLFYSFNNQSTWNNISLYKIGTPKYKNTWESLLTLPGSGSIVAFFKSIDSYGSNFSTGSPKNLSDAFPVPPNLLTDAAIESGNDADPNIPDQDLELTNFQISYSDNKIYGVLSNATGQWDWDGGFFGPWYAYGYAIINPPEFKRDSDTVYIAIRADAPFIITEPGLYKVYKDAGGNTQVVLIASIDYTESGGKLHIGVNWSSLLNDPQFGDYTGEIAVAAATAWADFGGAYFGDGTQPTRFYQSLFNFSIGSNSPCVLMNPLVNPGTGDTLTYFEFQVTYQDPDNNLPVIRELYIDNIPYVIGSYDHYYIDGSIFSDTLGTFTPGWHEFYFRFSDGASIVTTPLDSFFVQGVQVAETQREKTKLSLISYFGRNTLKVNIKERWTLSIFDLTGRKVYEMNGEGPSVIKIPLKKGTYYAKINSGLEELYQKLVNLFIENLK